MPQKVNSKKYTRHLRYGAHKQTFILEIKAKEKKHTHTNTSILKIILHLNGKQETEAKTLPYSENNWKNKGTSI